MKEIKRKIADFVYNNMTFPKKEMKHRRIKMENYLMIDGKKIELTEEQLKQIRGVKKNPFDRAAEDEKYFTVDGRGLVETYHEHGLECDNELYNAANYYTDEELTYKFAAYDTLHKLIRRFSYQNGGGNEVWDAINCHYYVRYDSEFWVDSEACDRDLETTYFSTSEIAKRAIEEIIKPYIREHRQYFEGIDVE